MKLAFTQHQGAPYLRQQDCLFNGFEIIQKLDQPVKLLEAKDQILVAVADGVSASPGAELASKFAIGCLKLTVSEYGFTNKALRSIQEKLSSKYARTRYFGTSTTLLTAQITGNQVKILSVGDCRAYLLTDSNQLQQLTKDHSFINQLIDVKAATESIQYASCYNVLTDCIVADFEETDFKIFATSLEIRQNERLMICTDGVYETLGDELANLINRDMSVDAQVQVIRDAVMRLGPVDNFSLMVIDTASNGQAKHG